MFSFNAPRSTLSAKPRYGWDPRCRLGGALLVSAGVVQSLTPQFVAVWGALAALALLLTPLPRGAYRAFIPLNILMLFLWLTLPFSVAGASWPPGLAVPLHPGITLAWLLTLKSNVSLAFLLFFCAGLDTTTLGAALQGMRVPANTVSLLLLTFRHLSTLARYLRASLQALQLRAPARQRLTLRTKMWIYACMLGSVLVYATRHAEDVRLALCCKPAMPRYDIRRHLHWRRRDSMTLALILLTLLLFIGGERVYLAPG
ncbi:energy-coupling factor transporter transmembrane component T [Edwardsiella anguillarum]|uniref:energy-coupling factor transporter transmembrane component T n=1 Tax=Edwardsiella anguillarum TaxID=1821960 RepID=UPI001FD634AA|nr:energy-coupling factor transporter transmembrane component T [Edwardsiella anguillarum]UOU80121.1 energy-coupling factor transporter transmembrane protein EcfT [Edwardsiella anguillarum]